MFNTIFVSVRAFGVIGGGATLGFAATGTVLSTLATSPIVPSLVGIGAAGGLMILGGLCMGPFFCVTIQGTCCLVVNSPNSGFVCPDTC